MGRYSQEEVYFETGFPFLQSGYQSVVLKQTKSVVPLVSWLQTRKVMKHLVPFWREKLANVSACAKYSELDFLQLFFRNVMGLDGHVYTDFDGESRCLGLDVGYSNYVKNLDELFREMFFDDFYPKVPVYLFNHNAAYLGYAVKGRIYNRHHVHIGAYRAAHGSQVMFISNSRTQAACEVWDGGKIFPQYGGQPEDLIGEVRIGKNVATKGYGGLPVFRSGPSQSDDRAYAHVVAAGIFFEADDWNRKQ